MTIIDDLAAAGIECEEAVRYDELRDFLGDMATGQYPKAADAMFSALARIAIDYKRRVEEYAHHLTEWDLTILERAEKAEAERDELKADPYKGQWKRKYMQMKAERDERNASLEAAVADVVRLVKERNAMETERDEWQRVQAMTQNAAALSLAAAEQAVADRDHARDLVVELVGENARLEVCGTCRALVHQDGLDWCGEVGTEPASVLDACHETPSHWTPYWDREEVTP